MNTPPRFTTGSQIDRHTDALSFACTLSGRLREVILKRRTLDRWTPVPDDAHGLLRVYDARKHEIQKAVQRRLAQMGNDDLDEVQLLDFLDGLVPEQAMRQPVRALSPIYCHV
jgi:hypothetical protein